MKYIKKYENIISEPKFNKGEWVRVESFVNGLKIYQSKPYKIVNLYYNTDNYNYWEYCLDTIDGGRIWRKEKDLQLVPEYELDAEKYNL